MSRWRTFIAMLLVTVAAAGLAGWAGVRYGLHHVARQADLDVVMHRDLDLTPAQDRRVHEMEASYARDRSSLEGEMRAANRDLALAITKDHAYSPAAGDAIARFHAAMSALQVKTVEHVLAMRTVLTPAQAKTFDREIARSLGTP